MDSIESDSVDLVVTSPPYPMIAMWDELFTGINPSIKKALESCNGLHAFELMHKELDYVWNETQRILKPGGIACINIGDATRTMNGEFMLYSNHSRIISNFIENGFTSLPNILWRKQTNAPNKFMGSGTLPPGAYITLEHEYILIFRKGGKREFPKEEMKQNRRESAYFWEERNVWFSDIWMDLKGTTQKLKDKSVRKRSAAYRFDIPYRLINMFSVKEDLVVDPFLGIGTTMIAALTAGRNSIGFEIDRNFRDAIISRTENVINFSNTHINNRLNSHLEFIEERFKKKGGFKHKNNYYNFPVNTRQEKELLINKVLSVSQINENSFETEYSNEPQEEYDLDYEGYFLIENKKTVPVKPLLKKKKKKALQLTLMD